MERSSWKKTLTRSGKIHVQACLGSLPPMTGHTEHPLPPEMKMQQHVCDAFTLRSSGSLLVFTGS